MRVEDKFEIRIDKMIEDCKGIGYTPSTFIKMRNEQGTVESIKKLVMSVNATSGYMKLLENGHLDLSLENIIQEPEWEELFTSEEREFAKKKL
jgi:hypothetical protein